jgi:serine protease Do
MPAEGFGEIAERLRRCTVQITAGSHRQGSGAIIKPDGIIVTNAHVAAAGPIRVQLWDGTNTEAALLTRHPSRDLAVLRIIRKPGLPSIPLADSDQVHVGELVTAIGNPFGFVGALSTGIVHAVGRVHGLGPMKWIQSDARLAPRNSGGPLANAQGCLVGVNTMIASGVGLAVPSNVIARVLQGNSAKAPLGLLMSAVEVQVSGQRRFGLLVLKVEVGGAAQMASLMPGDVVVGIEGGLVDSIDDLERTLDRAGQGVVRLQFLRGSQTNIRTVAVRLGTSNKVAA